MLLTSRRPLALLALVLAFVCGPLVAQGDFAKEEKELATKASRDLLSFASTAKSAKVGQRAKQAYDLVLGYYDQDNSSARSALGFKKTKAGWEALPPEKRTKWVDKATYEARFKIADEWFKLTNKLGAMHRALGLKMKEAGNLALATRHLERAVFYNPLDEEANVALGYKQGPGFYGTDAQIAFAHKMRELETKAIEIAKRDYPVQALAEDSMPIELKNLKEQVPEFLRKPNFDISGAKSEHFTVWTRGTPENAANCVKWGERALEFGAYVMGAEQAKRLHFVDRAAGTFAWYGFVWTTREREELLKANPHIWEKDGTIERAKDFANNIWHAKEGQVVVMTKLAPVQQHDSMIGYVFNNGFVQGRNEGLGQGIIHAACWYLQSTSIVRWGARPEGTVGDDALELPEQTSWWLRAIRDQATSNQDWALNQVPREKLARFRNDCRLKSWSFATWAMAAYPDQWLSFFLGQDDKKIPTLEEVDAVGIRVFGKPLADVEAEWREWARGDSGVAAATGYGPPLLPERPNKEEIAVLERLNLVRGTMLGLTWPKDGKMTDAAFVSLPPCELDAEASMACEDHSKFLARWPAEHLKWPEAHEENPALEGFTPRGQRAAMGSVIVHLEGLGGVDFARDSVDGWLGTPYHRFPLLEHNIRRFGYAYIFENGLSIATLDMGSLEEPYDPGLAPRFILWPPPNMENVPTDFHGREQPNPLEDQPEDQQDITKTGYPVSVQLQREIAGQLVDARIQLFEARKSGRQPTKHFCSKQDEEMRAWESRCKQEVPIWVHVPKVPLNKRVEVRDAVFCIPKEPLEKNKHYQARVMLQIGPADPLTLYWEFSTGSQNEGLRLGK